MSKHKPIDIAEFRVKGGRKIDLTDWPTAGPRLTIRRTTTQERLDAGTARLSELQEMLYAHDRYSMLVIFQAMDAAGKDGAIRHVMSGINPQGCQVFSFGTRTPPSSTTTSCGGTHVALPERGLASASSTARTTRRCSSCACSPRSCVQKLPDETLAARDFWGRALPVHRRRRGPLCTATAPASS